MTVFQAERKQFAICRQKCFWQARNIWTKTDILHENDAECDPCFAIRLLLVESIMRKNAGWGWVGGWGGGGSVERFEPQCKLFGTFLFYYLNHLLLV